MGNGVLSKLLEGGVQAGPPRILWEPQSHPT